jgi:hypothetical protein
MHVVTSPLGAAEPLRLRIREAALDFVQYATDDSRLAQGPESMIAKCVHVSALIDTANVAGMISPMNAKLITDEYGALARFIRDRYTLIRARDQDFSDVTLMAPSAAREYKGQKDTTVLRTQERQNVVAALNKGHIGDTRRASILSLFSNRDSIAIKDAVLAIPDVSEKTIQRELLAMVADGVLVKEGERRWSIYRRAPSV